MPAVSGADPDQGIYRDTRAGDGPAADGRASRRALAWLAAAVVLLVVAAVGGLATAYIVANLRAAPPPDAALLPTPTPTPTVSATPSVEPSAGVTATPGASTSPSAAPTPTGPAAEPTAEPTPFEYEVQAGDSITRIALRFGVTPESIIELNELRNPNRILPGQVLLIPGAPNMSPSPSVSP